MISEYEYGRLPERDPLRGECRRPVWRWTVWYGQTVIGTHVSESPVADRALAEYLGCDVVPGGYNATRG